MTIYLEKICGEATGCGTRTMRDVKDGVLRRGRDGGDVTLGAAAGLALLQNKPTGPGATRQVWNPGKSARL